MPMAVAGGMARNAAPATGEHGAEKQSGGMGMAWA